MPKLIVTNRCDKVVEVSGKSGVPLMEVLRDNDFDIAAICGGMCSCATCHVYVDMDWLSKLPQQEPDELDLLRELDFYKETSRLSCQIVLGDELDGLSLSIAPEE